MKRIIIVGSGGHAAELRDYVSFINNKGKEVYFVVGFLDDDDTSHKHYGFGEPLLGSIQSHKVDPSVYYLMGIANLKYRKSIVESFLKQGGKFTGLIHPTALISPSAKIGVGVVISHNASVGPMVTIGDYNILNSRCTIGHDTKMGDFNFISPQVAVAGNTTIGKGNLLGTNAATIPGVRIGDGNKIGAGAVVIKDVPNNVTVVGNMARILEKRK